MKLASSPEWPAFRDQLQRRIEKLRDQLESGGADPRETRGRIKELRLILETAQPKAGLNAGSPTYT